MINRFEKPRGRRHVEINGCVGAITVVVFGLVSALRDSQNILTFWQENRFTPPQMT